MQKKEIHIKMCIVFHCIWICFLFRTMIWFLFAFVLVYSGDKWSDGARGLARGHPDPSGYSTRWLGQRPGRLCPPLLTVSPSINESFKCMDQGQKRRAKKTFPRPKKERFISSLCNYAKGWLGIIPQEGGETEQTGTASLCSRGHFRLLITLKGVM